MSNESSVVFASCHEGVEHGKSIADAITESMEALADECVDRDKVEFLILKDQIMVFMFLEYFYLFENDLKDAFRKVGKDISVHETITGTPSVIIDRVKEKCPDWDPPFSGNATMSYILFTVTIQ